MFCDKWFNWQSTFNIFSFSIPVHYWKQQIQPHWTSIWEVTAHEYVSHCTAEVAESSEPDFPLLSANTEFAEYPKARNHFRICYNI